MFLLIIILLMLIVLFAVAPSLKCHRAEDWRKTSFAHRGLYGNGIAENTPEAFEEACKKGFGIELDVQFSRDGVLVVFHDDDLKRMTGDSRRVDEVDFDELSEFRLSGGVGSISRFEDVLTLVNGRVPLLVELKNGRRNTELCSQTYALLQRYHGRYMVESFNPFIVRWFKKHAREVLRGQLVAGRASYLTTMSSPAAFLLSNLTLNIVSRPDFIAYDVDAKRFSAPRIQRTLFHTPLAAWTVRDEKTYSECLQRNEMPIFEGFVPKHF